MANSYLVSPRIGEGQSYFYATRRLSEEASPYLIASQMDTSVDMLEKHYGQVINSTVAAQITGRKPSSIVVKGDIEFPF